MVPGTKIRSGCGRTLLRPNVILDQTATATAREEEAKKIPAVEIKLKRNQVIARKETQSPGNAGPACRLEIHRARGTSLAQS